MATHTRTPEQPVTFTRGFLIPLAIPRYDKYKEILQGTKEELPPLREVNHEINLIDPNAKYTYHLPRCTVALREQFHEKLNCYIDAGWWEPRTTAQAAPLMCIPKKDGRL